MGDARRMEEDVSVESPDLVSHYREAREIARRNRAGEATTEGLRLAIRHYRELFQSLLEGGGARVEEESGAGLR